MKAFFTLLLLISAVALLSACNFFTQPVDLQAQSLQNQKDGTQIAAVRATATVFADRLVVTLENAQTAVGSVDEQSTRIVSTLIAQGTVVVNASGITPIVPTTGAQTDSGAQAQIANPLLTPGAPQVNGQGSARGDTSLVPNADQPTNLPNQPTANPDGASLTNITLTESVGADDCPTKAVTSFTSDATDIYVTAMAHNVQTSNSLTADFSHEGQDMKSYTWSPKFAIRSACIWFHMPSSDVTFSPGNWMVVLSIDGAAVGAPIPFTITGNAPSQINVTPQLGG